MQLTFDQILQNARAAPDVDAFRFLPSGTEVRSRLSYGELAEQGQAIARALWARGVAKRPVAVILPAGPDVPVVLLGVMLAGSIAALLPVPRGQAASRRVASALRSLRPAAILCDESVANVPGIDLCGAPELSVQTLLEEGRRSGDRSVIARPLPDDPAIIQFSSGSTAEPRGIVLSHANIAANLAMIRAVSGVQPESVVVSWLPHSHDMGLFGAILTPLSAGATVVQMPPNAFLRNPLRWLKAMSEHRAHFTVAPDFGYALCLRRVTRETVAGLDLSSLSCAFIGAEPTRISTINAFSEALAPTGFKRTAFLSCYGLAEATLLCAAGAPEPVGRQVSCGRAVGDVKIAIRPTPLASVAGAGEIHVGGPHVALGLWRSETQDCEPFPGEFVDQEGTRMVPTGDLGMMSDGRLLVLDRLKDTLPIRGGTLGPSELETEACSVDDRIRAAAAVPAVGDRAGQVDLAIEIDDRRPTGGDLSQIDQRISERLAKEFGVQVAVYRFPPWQLPRTTSGKIQRFNVRKMIAASNGTEPDARQQGFQERAGPVSAEVSTFEKNGVISPLPILETAQAESLIDLLRRLARVRGELPPILKAKPHLLVPELWDLVHSSRVVEPVKQILGPDVLCFGTSFIWKPPEKELHVSWHQDVTHWGLSQPEAVTAWLAFTPSTRANGCVCVVPGTHKATVPHDHPDDPLNMLGRKEVARAKIAPEDVVPLELAPGEMSIHHGLVLHGSEPNRSHEDRIGFAMRFIASGNGQKDGPKGTATLVSGQNYGQYELETRPESLMAPAALRRHGHILRSGRDIIYKS